MSGSSLFGSLPGADFAIITPTPLPYLLFEDYLSCLLNLEIWYVIHLLEREIFFTRPEVLGAMLLAMNWITEDARWHVIN